MVAYVDKNLGTVPERYSPRGQRDLVARVKDCLDKFNSYAKAENNGIRERDILRLLLPVGITTQDIDPTWLATTSSFGRARGDTAHRSNQVDRPPDPKSELDTVTQIVEGLLDIDNMLLE